MPGVAVDGFDIDSMSGNVRRPIRTTNGAVMRHTPDTGRDDERYISKLSTRIKQLQGARLHRLKTESALTATAFELTRQEVLHGHTPKFPAAINVSATGLMSEATAYWPMVLNRPL